MNQPLRDEGYDDATDIHGIERILLLSLLIAPCAGFLGWID